MKVESGKLTVRERLIKLIHHCTSCEECHDADIADHLIANGVTVQKRGWIKVYSNAFYPYSCSECGNCHDRKVRFCSNCGTKLDLPEPPKEEHNDG